MLRSVMYKLKLNKLTIYDSKHYKYSANIPLHCFIPLRASACKHIDNHLDKDYFNHFYSKHKMFASRRKHLFS